MHSRLSRRSLVLARLAILAGFVQITSAGCGEDPEVCEEGTLGCACTERSECYDGLVCEDELCAASGGEGGEGGEGGADTAGSSGAPGTAGALGSADDPQGDGGGTDGASQGAAGASVDSPDPGASPGGMTGAGGENSGESGGAPSSGNGAGGNSGGSSGGSEGSSGGSGTSPFPNSCSGCYVEFGCFPEHLDCTSDPDCAPCVSTGYSPSLCDANPAFQALLECACASPCASHCSAVCD